MTPLDLLATCIVCATALGVTWIVAERWYVHRDRLVQRMGASAETTLSMVRDETTKLVRGADDHIRQSMEAHAAEVQRLRADVDALDRANKVRALGRG